MATLDLTYVTDHLDTLIDQALAGGEVVIARDGVPLVRLEAVPSLSEHDTLRNP